MLVAENIFQIQIFIKKTIHNGTTFWRNHFNGIIESFDFEDYFKYCLFTSLYLCAL